MTPDNTAQAMEKLDRIRNGLLAVNLATDEPHRVFEDMKFLVQQIDILQSERDKLHQDHARLVEGIQELQRGVDDERRQQEAAEFCEGVSWAQDIATATLSDLHFPPTK